MTLITKLGLGILWLLPIGMIAIIIAIAIASPKPVPWFTAAGVTLVACLPAAIFTLLATKFRNRIDTPQNEIRIKAAAHGLVSVLALYTGNQQLREAHGQRARELLQKAKEDKQ